jgi:hypothetical protein
MTKPNKLTKTQHIKNIIQANPNLPAKEVALRANCDVAMVYQIRKVMNKIQTVKVEKVLSTVKATPIQPKQEVSIKKACEVLINLVKDVDGLDIMLFDATIRLDLDGEGFECASDDVESIVKAMKLLQKHKQ